MPASATPLLARTAADLMSRDVVRLTETLPLRDAARLLLRHGIGGAPVVDAAGRCVGVLSAFDFVRQAERRADGTRPASSPLPVTCPFLEARRGPRGREVALCTLPPGVCPVQVRQEGPGGEEVVLCSQPHCVLADWQVVDVEGLPSDEVRRFMTPDPVTAGPGTPLRTLARMMVDAHVHRVIVVDEGHRPVGVVSTTDVLAALARADPEP
jgi:CBS domain-containing protein